MSKGAVNEQVIPKRNIININMGDGTILEFPNITIEKEDLIRIREKMFQLGILEEVEKQGKKDAKEDFISQGGRIQWVGQSCAAGIFPPAYLYSLWAAVHDISVPRHRQAALASLSDEFIGLNTQGKLSLCVSRIGVCLLRLFLVYIALF